MTTNLINSETICDLQGLPLHPHSVTLIKALDKLLTVGAYYSAEHEQYLLAAIKACQDIVGVIGSGKSLSIEITAQGMMIGSQNVDPRHRNVRLLHDLLVPLNIARLEIHNSLTPEDLRLAISALQNHKATLGQSNSFHEIVFKDLPASVQAVSCSVLQQGDNEVDAGKDIISLDELLGSGEEPELESETEQLARRFMQMVSQILENLDELELETGIKAQDSETNSYVTKTDLINLREGLQRLVEVNPDPAELTKLIDQAQRALDLSRDSRSVNLVFKILKNDMVKKSVDADSKKEKTSNRVQYKLTVEELLGEVAALETSDLPVEEPLVGSRHNHLAISLHLLRSDPPWALRTGMIDAIEQAVIHPDFPAHHLLLCAITIDTVAREDELEDLDDMLPLVTGVLRKNRPEMVAPFWVHLIGLSDKDQMPKLWPHLVNDILLGFEGVPFHTVTKLVLKAGEIPLQVAKGLGGRLEKQSSLHSESLARDLFTVPLKKVFPVIAMLVATPLRGWLGAELYRALRRNTDSVLAEVVMVSLDEHNPEFLGFYLDLIRHRDNEEFPAKRCELAVEALHGKLSSLSPEQRLEDWVPRGLAELGKMDIEGSRPLLEQVLNDRKFFIFKTWPAPAREAVANVLNNHSQEVK